MKTLDNYSVYCIIYDKIARHNSSIDNIEILSLIIQSIESCIKSQTIL